MLDLTSSFCAKCLFGRIIYKKRTATTGQVKVTKKFLEEIIISYLHSIVEKVEQYDIQYSIVVNLDQTLAKFASDSKNILPKAGSTNVPIAGTNDKCMIIKTTISLENFYLFS